MWDSITSRLLQFKTWLLSPISCVTLATFLKLSMPWLISDVCRRVRTEYICLVSVSFDKRKSLPETIPHTPRIKGFFQTLSRSWKQQCFLQNCMSREALSDDGA